MCGEKKGQNQNNDSTLEMIEWRNVSYFLWDSFLLNPATPIKPIPNRSMVAGSGVVGVVLLIAIASTPSINPANNVFFIFLPPELSEIYKSKTAIFSALLHNSSNKNKNI